jgi:hypothetical protein
LCLLHQENSSDQAEAPECFKKRMKLTLDTNDIGQPELGAEEFKIQNTHQNLQS